MPPKNDSKTVPLTLNENHKQILRTIRRREEPGKQSHIAADAGMPWSTAKAAIDSLMRAGLVCLNGKKELSVTPEYAFLCGVSVGKKTTVFVVLDFAHKLVSRDRLNAFVPADEMMGACGFRPADGNGALWSRETPTASLTEIGDVLMGLCELTLRINDCVPVLSFGMCFGDEVDGKRRLIRRSSILKSGPVFNVDLSRLLDRVMIDRFNERGIPILFAQNAICALICERTLGCLRGAPAQHGMVVYMGCGTGAAFLLNGKVLRDAGARFGHVRVLYGDEARSLGDPCTVCGSYGCLENAIRPLFNTGEANDPEYRSKNGDALAQWLSRKENEKERMLFAEYLSRSVLREVDVLGLEFVVFSGKLATLFPVIERPFRAKAAELQLKDTLQLLPSGLGDAAAAMGAALYAYFERIGEPID
ncbi:MAG: ROK family protein [Clostridia bacterium]|nr:ROK family protein [Clostridia bacterium]